MKERGSFSFHDPRGISLTTHGTTVISVHPPRRSGFVDKGATELERHAAISLHQAMTPADVQSNAPVRREDCPFCLPRADDTRYWIKVEALGISTLYLDRNQTYKGHCLLVFDARHTVGLESLPLDEFTAFMTDFHVAACAITAACQPDLMNYASLGNVVPHLHWHLVPRYRSDPRWGGPVYTTTREEMQHTARSEAEYREVITAIRSHLSDAS